MTVDEALISIENELHKGYVEVYLSDCIDKVKEYVKKGKDLEFRQRFLSDSASDDFDNHGEYPYMDWMP